MLPSHPKSPEHERVPTKVAERLLARASELDANSAALSELRRAAAEAGISAAAFDQALEEYRAGQATPAVLSETPRTAPGRAPRRFMVVSAAALFVGLAGFFAMRVAPASVQPVDPFQARIALSCASAEGAAAVARTLLDPSTSTITAHSGPPASLVVSAPTQEHLDRVRAAISEAEKSCTVPPR